MRLGLIVFLGSWGIVMGLLTSFVGLPVPWEPVLWFGAYLVYIAVILWRRAPPFETALAACLLSGVLVGPVQAVLLDAYVAANPWYAELLTDRTEARTGMIAQGIVAGFVFGLVVGALAWVVARITGRMPATPAPPAR